MLRVRRRFISSLALLCALGIARAGGAAVTESAAPPRPRTTAPTERILIANTRGCPRRIGQTLNFDTFRLCEICVGRRPTCLPVAVDDARPGEDTWIFVHGNRISLQESIRRGVKVYGKVRLDDASRPVRFIIWSWPSQRSTGPLRDARMKIQRTDVEAFLLASFLSKASASGPIKLIGYSFGSRIITGALHLTGGGSIRGRGLAELPASHATFRVALLAPAVENTALLPRGRHAFALNQVDRLLLMNNSRDLALHFYRVVRPGSKPRALGSTGLPAVSQPTEVQQFDWAASIGRDHSLDQYLCRPAIVRRVAGWLGEE